MVFLNNDKEERLGVFVLNSQRWNSRICSRQTSAKAFTKDVSINQERKLGDRRWSDTVVVQCHKRCRPRMRGRKKSRDLLILQVVFVFLCWFERRKKEEEEEKAKRIDKKEKDSFWIFEGNHWVLGFWGEYGCKAETWRNWRKGTTRSGACGLIWLNTGKLTRSRHNKDWQGDSSFLILWVVVHGRS